MIRNVWNEISETLIEQAALKALGLSGVNMTVEDCHGFDTACVERNSARARVRQCEGIASSAAYGKAQCENNERLNNYRFDLHCEKFEPIICPTFAQALKQIQAGARNTQTVTGADVFEARDRIFHTAIAQPDRPEFVSPTEQPRPVLARPAEITPTPPAIRPAPTTPPAPAPAPAPAPGDDEETTEEADGDFKSELLEQIMSQPWYVYLIVAGGVVWLIRK